MNSNLKISIIIPSYNQGKYLSETIQSVIDQHISNIEIIVMDGESTDNSVEVIKYYESHLAYWQSKKDNGQSDAINKGFKKASGEFVTWLNSDDVLLPGALESVLTCIRMNPTIDFFLGNVLWMNKDGQIIKVGKVESENKFWNTRHLFSNGGPSAFMRKSVLEKIGMLREDFHYMMDTELWHRLIQTGHPFKRINKYIWGLRLHEEAKMSGHNFSNSPLALMSHPSWKKKKRESDIITDSYPPNAQLARIWRLAKLLTYNFYTRYTDIKLLGKHFNDIR